MKIRVLSFRSLIVPVAIMLLSTISYAQNVSDDIRIRNVEPILSEAGNEAKEGKTEKALQLFGSATEMEPDLYTVWLERGNFYLYLQKYKEAIADLNKAIELNPSYSVQYGLRGLSYFYEADYDKAIIDLTVALNDENNRKEKFLPYRGLSYLYTNKFELSTTDFTEFIKTNPKIADAYLSRGQGYLALKNYQDAISDFNKASELAPSNWPAYLLRGKALNELKRYKEALTELSIAVKHREVAYFAYIARASAYISLNEFVKGKEDLNAAALVEPDSEPTLIMLSYLAFATYDNDRVFEYSSKCVELFPKSVLCHNNLAYSYLLQNKLGAAKKEIDAALAIDPNHYLALNNRALLAIKQKKYGEALKDVDRVLEIDPELPEVYLNRGYINYGRKHYQAAVADLTVAIQKKKDLRFAFDARALAYDRLGKKKLAEADRTEAAKLANEFSAIRNTVFGDSKGNSIHE